MTHDRNQLEYLLSQLGDGVLSADERRALEAVLQQDAAAAQLRRPYEGLERLLAHFAQLKPVANDAAAAARIKAALREQLEFQITQSLDRALDPADAGQLARTLAATPELAQHQADYQGLDSLIDRFAATAPRMDVQALSVRIKGAVRSESIKARVAHRPARRWTDYAGPLAVAAALLLTVATWRTPTPSSPGAQVALNPPSRIADKPALQPQVVVDLAIPRSDEGGVMLAFDTTVPAAGEKRAFAQTDDSPAHSFVSGRSDRVASGNTDDQRHSIAALLR